MGSRARSLNGLINCRETRLILRRYPSQLQGRMRTQTTGRVSNAGRAAARGATLNTCALPTRQLRRGKHSTPPILNSRSCGARPNKRQTNDQSANLLSRVWLRNGTLKQNPNNSGCVLQRIRRCGVKRSTRLRDSIAQRMRLENFMTFSSVCTKALRMSRRSQRTSRDLDLISAKTQKNRRTLQKRLMIERRTTQIVLSLMHFHSTDLAIATKVLKL